MLTGIVIFLCSVLAVLFVFFGYLLGIRYATKKVLDAQVNAMFDCGIDGATVRRIINTGKKYIGREKYK